MSKPKYTHWIYDVPKGSSSNKRKYFLSYKEAKEYIKTHFPGPKGVYHIYPVDRSGYQSNNTTGRKSYH